MFDKKQSLKVKGIAICMLLFHHLFYSAQRIDAYGVEFYWLSKDSVMAIATGMRLCVWIFAFLSAYGLTKQYMALGDQVDGRICGAFVWKRWLALMKPYWLILGAVIAISAVLSKAPMELFGGSGMNFVLCVFGLSDFFGTTMPVAAWWYMCFAQLLILMIPGCAELCKKFGVLVLVAVFALIPYMGSGISSSFGGSYTNYLFVIIMGVLCAQNGVMEKLSVKSSHRLLRALEVIGLAGAVVLCVRINVKYAPEDTWKFTKLFMGAGAVLTSLLVYKYCTNGIAEKVLMFLGRHSGNIFLLHAFGYTYFPKLIYWSHNVPLSFLTLLAVSVCASLVCEKAAKLMDRLDLVCTGGGRESKSCFLTEDTLIIKGIALLIMLLCHLFGRSEAAWSLFTYNPEWMVGGKPLITAMVSAGCGKVCVDLFVILSGFGLNQSFRKKYSGSLTLGSAARFAVGRIVKILMSFWCVYFVFGGIFTAMGKLDPAAIYGTGWQGIKAMLIDCFGLRDILFEITKTGTINATWWYMSAVLIYYALFPVFRVMVSGKYRATALAGLLLINLCAPFVSYRQFSTGAFFYLGAFYFGMLCSELDLFDRMKDFGKKHYIPRLIVTFCVFLLCYWITYHDRFRGEFLLALAWIGIAFVLLIETDAVLNRKVPRKLLAVLGKHSGGIFMFHTFFLQKFQPVVYSLKNPVLVMLGFTAVMVLVSAVFEFGKKKLGYYKLEKRLVSSFDQISVDRVCSK